MHGFDGEGGDIGVKNKMEPKVFQMVQILRLKLWELKSNLG